MMLLSALGVVAAAAHLDTLSGAVANPGTCVIAHCGVQLAECFADSVCRSWQLCILGCGTSNTSLPCQIRCADLHKPTDSTSAIIDKFSECVFPEHHCVPPSQGQCKPPANVASLPAFLVESFAPEANTTWYITRGDNPMFDCFDCQVHHFTIDPADPAGKILHGALAYSVRKDLHCSPPDCDYLQREVFQSWSVDLSNTAHLINHNNTLAELHYADDWYVLASKPGSYILVYYCGCNDASCGYGGAVLYTRKPRYDLPAEDVAVLKSAIKAAGVEFTLDTMCTPSYVACKS